ncbi:hypothetical protein NDI56_07230 [Haloarcula sp. S1CR25-12]|uniref:Uncharacterized protein n=1 Tax=Haloarcula saliterrae TaxID=2950534 RepID=A0ABU2FA81_9EURY|nr:hypothetical protein [Haloarcula sp. S1CR25-12]MDS0259182.1 hypothetical protein [Haloarcula sp. S1CR25-12]
MTVIGAFFFTQGGALAVYEGTSPGVEQPQADRIASYVVENYSTEGDRNVLRYDSGPGSIDVNLSRAQSAGATKELTSLIEAAGADVQSDRRTDPIVNVSIVNGTTLDSGDRTPAMDGSRLAWGEYRRSEPVTSSRVVQLTNYDCGTVCWVVVRIW